MNRLIEKEAACIASKTSLANSNWVTQFLYSNEYLASLVERSCLFVELIYTIRSQTSFIQQKNLDNAGNTLYFKLHITVNMSLNNCKFYINII